MADLRVVVVAEQLRRRVPGGIGTYVQGLAQGLRALDGDQPEVIWWASRAGRAGTDPVASLGTVETSPLPSPLLTRAWEAGVAGPRRASVVHAASLAIPPSGGAPLSVMVHDVAWRTVPDAYPARGRRWHERGLARALARATVLIVPSQPTADDLVAAGAPARRVEVVAEGADHLPPPDHTAAADLLQGLGVRGEFLLTVSTLEPRKNLARLVAAYEAARDQLPEPWPLVVVGPAGWGDSGIAQARVVAAGAVTAPVLAALYARARLLAYVPLMEGFGLPVLEAMRAGAPVVASPVPSAGGATLEVDPRDTASIAAGLVRAATDDARRAELVEAGRKRAAGLTWAETARRHVDIWESMHGRTAG